MGINISKVNGKSFRKKKNYFLLSRERQRKVKVELGPDLFLIRKDLLIRRLCLT